MENTTEFDLNAAIQRWREHLRQSPHFRAENLAELEAHLRDAVALLHERGLSEEEALLIGTRRIGGAPALELEFAKVNGREIWLDRLLWMLAGVLLWRVADFTSQLFGWGFVSVGLLIADYGFNQTNWILLAVLLVVVQVTVLGACLWGSAWIWRRNRNWFGDVLSRLLRRSRLVVLLGASMLVAGLLCISLAPHVFRLLFIRHLSVESYGSLAMASSIAVNAVWILEVTAMVFALLLLARRRLHPLTHALQ